MASYVTLRYVGAGFDEDRNLQLVDGRLDWWTVKDVFGADRVEVLVEGVAVAPSVFPPGHPMAGLTRSTFQPFQTIPVKVTKQVAQGAGVTLGPWSACAVGDTTAAYLALCLTPLDGDMLRKGVNLERLKQALTPRLPLPWKDADILSNQGAELRNLLVSTAEEPQAATARKLYRHVGNVVVCGPCEGTSERHTMGRTLDVVEKTLCLIRDNMPGPNIRMGRNSCDTSGATGKRLLPDFMCWVNNALLFKGEEEASEAGMPAAVKELKGKVSAAWLEGLLPGVQAPCMLAYAAAGHLLQFFCIKRSGDAGEPLLQPISSLMNLRLPMGRAMAVTATCNVYRLMVGFVGTMPAALPFALGDVINNGQSSVMLLQGFVRKEIPEYSRNHAAFVSVELLQGVYAAMAKPEHKGSIVQACGPGKDNGPTLRGDKYVVHLAPVGVPVRGPPDTERELAQAVRGALTGLAALHLEGFVHRDVRWPNLVKLPADDHDRWLLVDLEHAGRDGDDCSQEPYPLRFWSSDTLAPNGAYTTASDLKMLAQQLLSDLSFELSSEGCDLRQRLCSGALSAADALQHSWFATHT